METKEIEKRINEFLSSLEDLKNKLEIDDKKKRTPDFALYELGKILVKIAEEKTEDIRESLKKYKDEIDLKVSI